MYAWKRSEQFQSFNLWANFSVALFSLHPIFNDRSRYLKYCFTFSSLVLYWHLESSEFVWETQNYFVFLFTSDGRTKVALAKVRNFFLDLPMQISAWNNWQCSKNPVCKTLKSCRNFCLFYSKFRKNHQIKPDCMTCCIKKSDTFHFSN